MGGAGSILLGLSGVLGCGAVSLWSDGVKGRAGPDEAA
jgi:hypothetical protein